MLASWNSNSKSETARRPRTTTAPLMLAREVDGKPVVAFHRHVRQVTQHAPGEVDAGLQREHRGLVRVGGDRHHDASKMLAARRTRSWCPFVIGSKVPG